MKEIRCHDCNCREGELHLMGCDMERCPFCGNQLVSCDCCYEQLDVVGESRIENEEKWIRLLEAKGRIPYVQYPNLCSYCGKLWPEFFKVSEKEWNYYIEPKMRHKILCRKCYNHIKKVINEGRRKH